MAFELRVEFAGLCLYMLHPVNKQVAILMPDARKTADDLHADGELGEQHTGYVRFDLANVAAAMMGDEAPKLGIPPGVPDNGAGSPPYEVVHRFDRETLEFSARDTSDLTIQLGVPEFDKFGRVLKPIDNLFTNTPPGALLMRTILEGGNLQAKGAGKTWAFSSPLRGTAPDEPYSGQFAGFALWTSTIEGDRLNVAIRKFDDSGTTTIPLKAVEVNGKNVIAIKVANLCANNPLEWDEFPLRTVVNHDLDFKWLYRLLTPPGSNQKEAYRRALAGAELPFPRAMRDQAYGDEDCMGGSITGNFP